MPPEPSASATVVVLRESERGPEVLLVRRHERERALLALDRLLPFARWITPEVAPRRWDARFFLAEAPAGQSAQCDGTETCEALWMAPGAALDAYRAGEHLLAPPTFRVLEE